MIFNHKKGIYCCNYINSFDKFNNTELPKKEEFYSILNDEHISNNDYKHAKKVLKVLKIWVNIMIPV